MASLKINVSSYSQGGSKLTHPFNSHFDLFSSTPYLDRWEKRALKRCIGVVVLITWFPLVVLASLSSFENFLMDISIFVRFFIALPLLLLSPSLIQERFHKIINHFIDSDIVKDSEREKFISSIQSTIILRDSRLAKMLIWIIVYVGALYFTEQAASHFASTWKMTSDDGELTLSLAGRWFIFVSWPIQSFFQFFFIYRILLWWRFLFLVSRLDLQLSATHGDDTGGLVFLGGSIKGFQLPVLAFSTSVAAGTINLVLYKGFEINDLKFTILILIVICLLLFIGPLFLFFKPLIKVKQRATLSYGRLSGHQLELFENKWLYRSKEELGPSLTQSSEFSTVTDTISIVNRVYKMRTVPFTKNALIGFIFCIILPFLPVLALKLPWIEIFKELLKLIM